MAGKGWSPYPGITGIDLFHDIGKGGTVISSGQETNPLYLTETKDSAGYDCSRAHLNHPWILEVLLTIHCPSKQMALNGQLR